MPHPLDGVYAAAVTPLSENRQPDRKGLFLLLESLLEKGCLGALLLGTTGEGPSFSISEKAEIMKLAGEFMSSHPEFKLLAGTGTPSIADTIELTKIAFSHNFSGVVVLPPYYYKKVNDQGLFNWFSELINAAVPTEGYLLAYHIPPLTGIGFSPELIEKLKEIFPQKFAGIKDSSSDSQFCQKIGDKFGNDLLVLTGNDRLLTLALNNHAGGCITALANLFSSHLRRIWDDHQVGKDSSSVQDLVTELRKILDRYTPYAPMLKALLCRQFGFKPWAVHFPMAQFSDELINEAEEAFAQAQKSFER